MINMSIKKNYPHVLTCDGTNYYFCDSLKTELKAQRKEKTVFNDVITTLRENYQTMMDPTKIVSVEEKAEIEPLIDQWKG